MPTSQPLPPKEKTLFNRVLKCYEQKQYKNGLKFAKQILSNPKYSEHGETMAMKGLTLNCIGKRDEAYELVKRGLKNDLKSHVCWHVYGLLQRSEKKYDEAIKCYRNALRWDKENLHILRDLSMLQVHMRDLEGYRDTRYALLQLKPAQRASWIGYAISNHLLKDYMVAYKVLEEFNKTQTQTNEALFEQSELLLYQVEILCEACLYHRALEHLEKNKEKIVDKLTLQETKGQLLIQLGRTDEAEEIFTDLVYRNPENHKYYEKLELVIKVSNQEERLQIYQAVSQLFPKADSPKLLPLKFATGELFRTLINQFMKTQLKRAVPTLFTSLKFLYSDSEKVQTIYEIMQGYLETIEKCSKFNETDDQEEPPTAILWARYFLAQHYDHLHQYDNALKILNEALYHTPTLVDLYILKAKVLKHMGDCAAVESMDEAQSLDTADRFVNCRCAGYMIRHDMITEASDIAAKFTRENVSVDDYLREMQCMWYEVECAAIHARQNRYGEALKKCHEIDRHFNEIVEDQFDFHQYCMRKMTLRAYMKMLKLEDSLRSHKFYFEAARIAIKVYLQLHDDPCKKGDRKADENEAGKSDAEIKKLKNKQRRLERKKAAQDEKKKQELDKVGKKRQQQKNTKSDEEIDSNKVVEFQPEKLVSVDDPLKEARHFLLPLELHRPKCLETHFFAFEIAERQGKLLLMLRALLRSMALGLNANNAEFHLCKVHFLKKVEDDAVLTPSVKDVIEKHFNLISNNLSAVEFNENFLKENVHSLPHLFAGCKAKYFLNNDCQNEALRKLLSFNEDFSGVNPKVCESIFYAIKSRSDVDFGIVSEEIIEEFRVKFSTIFPGASDFSSHVKNEIKMKNSSIDKVKLVNGNSASIDENVPSEALGKVHGKVNIKKSEEKIEQLSALVEDHCPLGV